MSWYPASWMLERLAVVLWHLLGQGRCYSAHVLVCCMVVATMLATVGVAKMLTPLVFALCMFIFWVACYCPEKLAGIEGANSQCADMGIGTVSIKCVKHAWTPPPSARLDNGCSIVVWCSIRKHAWPPGLDILRFSNEATEIFGGSFQGLPLELLLHGSSVSAIWHAIDYVIKEVNSPKQRTELCQCAKSNLDSVRLLSWDGSFTANLSILCVRESEAGAEIICLGIKRNLDIGCTAELNEGQATCSEAKMSRQHLKVSLARKTALRSGNRHSSWKTDFETTMGEYPRKEKTSSQRSSSVPSGWKYGKRRRQVRFSLPESHSHVRS